MNTISESCVSFLLPDKLNDVLKFGLPITSVNEEQASKQYPVSVAFWANPVGSASETSDTHSAKHHETLVAFCPNPAGKDRDVSVEHDWKQAARLVVFCPNPAGKETEASA